jgi:predicted dehydrogenase|tara:strand:- start:1026 stop:2168 length:1143 start_codon:yes stop_codon:yes gene_type:complete
MKRIKLGMVGGGEGAFIGEVHRMASRLDDRYILCAGALCSDAKKAVSSALSIGISQERSYSTYQEMAATESDLVDGIEVVAIVTPNHLHHPIAKEFLLAGIHVICDKPMTINTQEARELIDLAKTSNLMLAVTYNYSAYPMIRHARAMVQSGELGKLRVVQTKYTQDWLTEPLENTNHKQAHWRVDPKKSGVGGCVGDIGTHAYHLSCFVTQLKATSLCADLSSFVDGRRLDDNAHIMIRYKGNTKGMIWSSQVAPGNGNNLEIQIYGDKGGLVWRQEQPNELIFSPINKPSQTLLRGSPDLSENANALSRVPVGHPEGYIEGFANLYREIADALMIYRSGKKPSPGDILFPTGEDGYDGVSFVEAAVQSNNEGSVWISL